MPNQNAVTGDERIVGLLEDLVKLTRFSVMKDARRISSEVLDTPTKKRVYELSDGVRTCREIAGIAKVNKDTVSKWWREWHAHGLVKAVPGTHGTREAVFSLLDLESEEK